MIPLRLEDTPTLQNVVMMEAIYPGLKDSLQLLYPTRVKNREVKVYVGTGKYEGAVAVQNFYEETWASWALSLPLHEGTPTRGLTESLRETIPKGLMPNNSMYSRYHFIGNRTKLSDLAQYLLPMYSTYVTPQTVSRFGPKEPPLVVLAPNRKGFALALMGRAGESGDMWVAYLGLNAKKPSAASVRPYLRGGPRADEVQAYQAALRTDALQLQGVIRVPMALLYTQKPGETMTEYPTPDEVAQRIAAIRDRAKTETGLDWKKAGVESVLLSHLGYLIPPELHPRFGFTYPQGYAKG